MQKITLQLLSEYLDNAAASNRKRVNLNFHLSYEAKYQRMLNCLFPESYCRPHRHLSPAKCESFIILKGRLLVLEFDDNGNIIEHIVLEADSNNLGADFQAGCWHSIIALSPCVVFEAKDGPYNPADDKEFALWAPEEGSAESTAYMDTLLKKLNLR